jgi:DNA invertase Pin-like site-specific DNA recombinase
MEKEIKKVTDQYTQNPVTKKIERVAAYIRVSSQEQKLHGLSLDAQRMKLQEYADAHHMKIVEWYEDEGVSGRKLIRNRPALQRMIQDAEQKKFDRIIFIKLDRFFRSVAEYHECMKRISPVLWSTTEEQYDLSTANGRMLVNMKLTIAEMEADQGGERIRIVNEYKTQTGQPLVGKPSLPFGFMVETDPDTHRKKVVHDPDEAPILMDAIANFMMHQSRRKTLVYLHSKYHISMTYKSLTNLFSNTMLYGAYRDNPVYCTGYIDKELFDKMQEIMKRNIKANTAENRDYIFSGLIKCPLCGCTLKGNNYVQKKGNSVLHFKKYRCGNNKRDVSCSFNKVVAEKTLERLLLANIEQYLNEAKIRAAEVEDADTVVVPKYDIADIHEQIDRLNYSWQTGKIRKVEQYEKDYAALQELLEKAEAEQNNIVLKDFSKVEAILQDGWRGIYENLDDAHKRAFWRSFIRSIELLWTTETKEITRVNFF